MDETQQSRLSRAFWVRHANPWSGSSRTVTLPVLVYAVFTRRWRLLAAGIAFSIVDPVLVSPPRDSDAWMTKVELAERRWRERGDELGALQLLNVLNVPVTLYAFYAAYHQRPDGATVATSLSTTLKFIFVAALVRRYEDDLETVDWNDFETDD